MDKPSTDKPKAAKETVKVVAAVEEDKPKVVVEETVDDDEEAKNKAAWEAFLAAR